MTHNIAEITITFRGIIQVQANESELLTLEGTTLKDDSEGLIGWQTSSSRLYSEPEGSGAVTLT